MGGKALKNTETRRYTKKEYQELQKYIETEFPKFTNGQIYIAKSYNFKETFGDMDVLVEVNQNNKYVIQTIIENVGHSEVNINSNCTSFAVNGDFQVDLISIPSESFEFAKVFYSYNDIGMILGRMLRNCGLLFGFTGLRLKMYSEDKTEVMLDLMLSRDPKQVFKILKLNFQRFLQGFDTMQDVFEYASTSPFFCRKVFEKGFQNSENQRRDNKRQSFTLLREWIVSRKYQIPYDYIMFQTLAELLDFCEIKFPRVNVIKQYKEANERYSLRRTVREKLSEVIFRLFDSGKFVEGREFGKLISEFKKTKEDFPQYCLDSTIDKIKSDFLNYVKDLKNE